ncbi:biopolymer transporter Tol [Leucobacter sp. CSA1]|uniref:Biopolymer transporter Tol n=1 Tax=Leucobacter chromiisoli TaxID=2796471 RepID=A0A934Q785_9MICO|nr:biopolymer transporter Tol [Leucobacter chromiisoli]MBK0419036.1 biopolymer transporter Tol [Leucobacter chromiisoli]
MTSPERTEDGRYIVVGGRRWRASDPLIPDEVAAALRSELGRARSRIRTTESDEDRCALRDRVQLAKEGLGERGTPWWEMSAEDRRERAEDRLRRLRG